MDKKQIINKCVYVKNAATPTIIYSDCEICETQLKGSLWCKDTKYLNKICLREEKCDYDNIKAIYYNDIIYTVFTCYENGYRNLFIAAYRGSNLVYEKCLLSEMKIDNIDICIHDQNIYISCENYTDEYVSILILEQNLKSGECINNFNVTKNELAYKPVMVSANENLYLAYEAFYGERYHIIMRILEKNSRSFTNGFEVGFDTVNDQSPSLFAKNNDVYVSWENSSPLFTDYTWQPPDEDSPTVYMPSYGHGWRVFTRMGSRKIEYHDGYIDISCTSGNNMWDNHLELETNEVAGEISTFILNDTFFVIFSEYSGNKFYRAVVKYYDNGKFVKIQSDDILYYERKKPVFTINEQELHITVDNPYEIIQQYSIELSKTRGSIPLFVKIKQLKLNTITGTPQYVNPVPQIADIGDEKLNLYWGDLHMHSNASMCSRHEKFHCSSIVDKNRFSKDVGRLDFCLLTDHETMNDYEWIITKKSADFNNIDNTFTSFLGYEWTSSMMKDFHNYGHYNILYRQDGQLRRIKDGTFDNLETLWNELDPNDVITIPHHPSDNTHPVDWNYFNKDFVPLVEIYQVRGSYEYDECEFDPRKYGRGIKSGNSVQTGLNRGYRFGFTSGGEHEGVGITGVFAKELTRDAIFDALKKRRVYGTTSEKIFLTFFVNDSFMGSEITSDSDFLTITGKIIGTDEIEYIKTVSNLGTQDITESYDKEKCYFNINIPSEGCSWIYLRIKQKDGNIAWASPVFVDSFQE